MTAAAESDELSGLPIMLKVEEAARVLRIGRTLAYELAARFQAGDATGLPVVRLGSLLAWADRCTFTSGDRHPDTPTRSTGLLNLVQAEAAAVAGWDDLVLIFGPAGTGKTTALTPAIDQLRADGRAVFGVAPSAAAAEVLTTETGVAADTVDKLLIEHRLPRPPDHRYDLPVGATVIVDEAGMIPTARLAELADLADLHGWRTVLVGDPLQFSAVGRGGMFGLLVDTFDAVEPDRVHRFTHHWERDASLRVRAGDLNIADLYDDHGRLHGGTPDTIERAAVAAWWSHRQAGETVTLMAPANETVDRLNQRAQQQRLRAGELDADSRSIHLGEMRLLVSDEIATRRNDRHLVTDQGEMIRNRARWTISTIHLDGSLTATGRHGQVHLRARYVAEHVELAYATTSTANQGRTVDHALLVVDRPCDVRNLYVAMSRGSQSNHAYLAVRGEQTAADVFARCLVTDWIDQPAHTRRAELRDQPPHRAGLLDGAVLRDLLERRHELADQLRRAEARQQRLPGELRQAEAAKTAAEETIAGLQAEQRRLQGVIADYDRPLRRHRHQGGIIAARHHLADIPNRLADDLRTRTRVARREQPEAILTDLGPRPRHGHDAHSWDTAAGRLAQHQAAFDINGGLGPRPGYYDRSPYRDGHDAVAEPLQPLERPVLHHAIEPPDLGLSL